MYLAHIQFWNYESFIFVIEFIVCLIFKLAVRLPDERSF